LKAHYLLLHQKSFVRGSIVPLRGLMLHLKQLSLLVSVFAAVVVVAAFVVQTP
jgi:hypothetical protein